MLPHPSRRSLLALSAASIAATVAGRGASAGGKPAPLKLGLASYSMRKLTLEHVVDTCLSLKIKYLTIKEMHLPLASTADQIQQARTLLNTAGIEVAGVGVLYMKNEEEVRRGFAYAKELGAPLIVGAPNPELIDVVEKAVQQFDLPLAIHNHGPEDKHYPTPREILAVIKRRDRRLGICMDVGHTVRAGLDPIKCVAECGARLFDLHIKDLKTNDKESRTEVGQGMIDNAGLLKALTKRRFTGHLALEYEINPEDPVPGIRESMAYLRGVLAGIGA